MRLLLLLRWWCPIPSFTLITMANDDDQNALLVAVLLDEMIKKLNVDLGMITSSHPLDQ